MAFTDRMWDLGGGGCGERAARGIFVFCEFLELFDILTLVVAI